MAPELQHDFGLSPAGFGTLSSCFFRLRRGADPHRHRLDRYGVGRPTAGLLAVGAVSAVLFAAAPNGGTAMLAQAGLGPACAPVFMGLLHFASEQLPETQYTVVSRSNATGMIGALRDRAARLGGGAVRLARGHVLRRAGHGDRLYRRLALRPR